MSNFNYLASAYKANAVGISMASSFLGPDAHNLVVCRKSQVTVYSLQDESMVAELEFSVNGSIEVCENLRLKGSSQDLLLIVTGKYKFCVLEYDGSGNVVTKANGDFAERNVRMAEDGCRGYVDPLGRLVILSIAEGMLKAVPIDDKGNLADAFDMRVDEQRVIDVAFLQGYDKPTIAVLFEDVSERRGVKTFTVNMQEKDLEPGPWEKASVERTATLLQALPLPIAGLVVVAEQTIAHIAGNGNLKAHSMQPPFIARTLCPVDANGSRLMIADNDGILYMLGIDFDGSKVLGLRLDRLGETSTPEAIVYIDAGVIFIGSAVGDSQLVRISQGDDGADMEVLASFTNIGPVIDFELMNTDKQGQSQLVCCSGCFQDSSLRIVRAGVGLEEQAAVELEGIKAVWSLRGQGSQQHKYLVQSFVGQTRMLALEEEELGEAELSGFDYESETLDCGELPGGQAYFQVTNQRLNVHPKGIAWQADEGTSCTVACHDESVICVSTGKGGIKVFGMSQSDQGAVSQIGEKNVGVEIGCMSCATFDKGVANGSILTVGTWDKKIRVFSLPSFEEMQSVNLSDDTIPRSLCLTTLGNNKYLLAGLGNGSIVSYLVDSKTGALTSEKTVQVGLQPVNVQAVTTATSQLVVAACDRPAVIYEHNDKLLFSSLNVKSVVSVCPFDAEDLANCLALATTDSLVIGTADDVQRLHIRTIPLGEHSRRIAYDGKSGLFAVASMAATQEDGDSDVFRIRLVDDTSFEMLQSCNLEQAEMVCSLTSARGVGGLDKCLFAAGATTIDVDSDDSEVGRVVLFEAREDKSLSVIAEKQMGGGVNAIQRMGNHLVVATRNEIHVLQLDGSEGSFSLGEVCKNVLYVEAIALSICGEFIFVADIMRSVAVLKYNQTHQTLEENAQHFEPMWCTAIQAMGDKHVLVADNEGNLHTLERKDETSQGDQPASSLQTTGFVHVGDLINCFRQGSLVSVATSAASAGTSSTGSTEGKSTVLFGTVGGAIGAVIPLSEDVFKTLNSLQQAMTEVVSGVGGLSHSDWRALLTRPALKDGQKATNFIDGDLVETLLDLPADKQKEVCSKCGLQVDSTLQQIEELSRMH